MKIDIYKSDKHENKFLLMESNLVAEGINIKDPDFQKVVRVRSGLDIDSLSIDKEKAKRNIDTAGYHIVTLSCKASELPT